ncbi:MAG: hypothetical protein SOZ40_01495 [Ezakiella sp.]|nr:hypothetical protein [Bacillota bacterium]MDY3946661.1 hypothetical protein [Ezakiella sp.]
MVKFILGKKGSGKTKWLIEGANEDIKQGNGNIAFLDTDDEHIFSLDYNVRLINVKDFGVETLAGFYGFISGMLAMDYDLEKVYIDSIYKLIDIKKEDLAAIYQEINKIAEKSECEIYLNLDFTKEEVSPEVGEVSIEVQ